MTPPIGNFKSSHYDGIRPLLNKLAHSGLDLSKHTAVVPNTTPTGAVREKQYGDFRVRFSLEDKIVGFEYSTKDLGENRDYFDINENGQRDDGEDNLRVEFGGMAAGRENPSARDLAPRVYGITLEPEQGAEMSFYNLENRSQDDKTPLTFLGYSQPKFVFPPPPATSGQMLPPPPPLLPLPEETLPWVEPGDGMILTKAPKLNYPAYPLGEGSPYKGAFEAMTNDFYQGFIIGNPY